MKQKDVFLSTEADAWFERNHEFVSGYDYSLKDPIVRAIKNTFETSTENNKNARVLEIGCGEGRRLQWLKENLGYQVCGIEPSIKAVNQACSCGLDVQQGTADHLPFDSGSFDIVIFGFCLYLCDQEDLFRISMEADRVLKTESWLFIHDFYSPSPTKNEYHHKSGLYSTKMDYRTLFTWHPSYTCYQHMIFHHSTQKTTDDPQEWVATSVLRKK